jgi:hypothetical protein
MKATPERPRRRPPAALSTQERPVIEAALTESKRQVAGPFGVASSFFCGASG